MVLISSTDSDFITVTLTKALLELEKRKHLKKIYFLNNILKYPDIVQVPILQKPMEAQGVLRTELVTT